MAEKDNIPSYSTLRNWTANNTDEDNNGQHPITELSVIDVIIIAACSVLIVCALLGNVLVIFSVATNRRLRTVTNCYIVSLAVADTLVAVLVMPLAVAEDVTRKWLLGRQVGLVNLLLLAQS